MDRYALHIVTGAPGAGKSTSLAAFLNLESEFIAFDIDWLIEGASDLAGQDLHSARLKWQSYNSLWLDMLHAIFRNHRCPVLFAPLTPTDLRGIAPHWCSEIRWLLLDCPDAILRRRLEGRDGWTESGVQEALADASKLRSEITEHVVDTNSSTPSTTARVISKWLSKSGRI